MTDIKPPYLSRAFLRWFCTAELVEEIEGDLMEEFVDNSERMGRLKARWLYNWTVIRSLRPYLIKSSENKRRTNPIDMFKNYIKIALRNLIKQRNYTLTNIFGLSTGIVSVFLILIFIDNETSYDKHHEDFHNIYRVATSMNINDDNLALASSPPGLAQAMAVDFPEIETATRLSIFVQVSKNLLQYQDRQFFETQGFLADSSYFRIFNFEFIHGDRTSALNGPQKVVLSSALSSKLFANEDPIGKLISITNNHGKSDYEITGVYDENKHSSHVSPAFICSMNSGVVGRFIYASNELAGNNFLYTYIKLREGSSPDALEEKLPAFLDKHIGEQLKSFGATKSHHLQNVADIHLTSDLTGETGINGSVEYIYILLSIAVFILVIACINFMNMATAQSAKRAKEIGVRKVFGAYRSSLIYQFLGEAVVITFLSILISVVAIHLLLPYFNVLVERNLVVSLTNNLNYLLLIIGLGIITSLLAGSYPAIFLSSQKIVNIIKGRQQRTGGGLFIRKGLVIFQFIIAITLIIGVVTVRNQIHYVQNKSLGFQKENRLVIPLQSAEGIGQYQTLRNQVSAIAGVKSVAGVSYYPGEWVLSDNLYFKEGSGPDETVRIQRNNIDFGFMETLGVEVVKGRAFSEEIPSDVGGAAVLNETAVKNLGYDINDVVGRKIFAVSDTAMVGLQIVGVIRDFNFMSLHAQIDPYMFIIQPNRVYPYIMAELETNDYPGLVDQLESQWEATLPNLPFEYFFLDSNLNKLYDDDRNFGQIIESFTFVAIIICALGLFGLSAYTTEQRLKEIAVRKVLGASVGGILFLLNRSFSALIFIAFIVAAPLGYYAMDQWLNNFQFRIGNTIPILLLSGLVALIFTLMIVSIQSMRGATRNPATILRSE